MSQILVTNVSFCYDGSSVPVFDGLTLTLDTDWKLALVGRNGRGKTTVMRLMEGGLDYSGDIICSIPCVHFPKAIEAGVSAIQVLESLTGHIEWWQVQRELSLLGLEEERLSAIHYHKLSGGEQTRLQLAALFAHEHVYPMLDEPTNHLDAEGRELVAAYLREKRQGFLLASHDGAFLDACTDHVLALNPVNVELVKANFSVWFADKEARDRGELLQNASLRQEIKRLEAASQRSQQWSNSAEAGKYHTKNSGLRPDRGYVGHKAASMMKRAKGIEQRRHKAVEEKARLLQDIERTEPLKLFPLAFHSQRLLELRDLSIQYGERRICKEVSFQLNRGQRISLQGGNGAGKTSLIRLILGEEVPYRGTFYSASGIAISYVPQNTAWMSGSLKDFIQRNGIDETQFYTILRKLDFPREVMVQDTASYSQGQKKKVLLAISLCQSAHLYIWDEPLNYIDLFSRKQIQALILQFSPTMLFVEHDRNFTNTVATEQITLFR